MDLMYALYHRDGASNLLTSPERVQQLIARGLEVTSSTQISPRSAFPPKYKQTEAISKIIADGVAKKAKSRTGHKEMFLDDALEKLDHELGIFLIYGDSSHPSDEIANFWDEEFLKENIFTKIKNPPIIRQSGWSLRVADSEMPQLDGGAWSIMNGTRKLTKVTQTGEVIAAISVKGVMNWGTEKYIPADGSIDGLVNGFALTEYIYCYLLFIKELMDAKYINPDMNLTYGLYGTGNKKISLLDADGFGQILFYEVKGKLGKTTEWNKVIHVTNNLKEAAADMSLSVIKAGFSVRGIPRGIRKSEDGTHEIDVDYYKSVA